MKVLLVDDHQIFRDSLIDHLKQESFCDSVDGASSTEEARERIGEAHPDVLVTDLSLSGESGMELLRWARQEYPEMPTACLTMHAELNVLREALEHGVSGFVTKSSGYDELVGCIKQVARGGNYLDQVMLRKVFQHFRQRPTSTGTINDVLSELTEREREIFTLLLQDYTLDAIAERLYISPKTVENHRSNIYGKLSVHDRLSLLNFARSNDLVD